MDGRRKKLFSDDDFDKHLSIGDELIFDKPELTKLRVDLTWAGTDLDVCAFLLDKDGFMTEKSDLVYFGSKLRWKTKKAFNDPNFNALDGEFSEWPAAGFKNPTRWREETLPISTDGSVIGSWDDKGDKDDDETDADGNPPRGEQMFIQLDEVDVQTYKTIVLAAVVAKDRIEKGETFADAYSPIVSISNVEKDEEIAIYQLNSKFPSKDAVCFARLEYDEESLFWNFVPMDDSYNGGMQYLAQEVYDR